MGIYVKTCTYQVRKRKRILRTPSLANYVIFQLLVHAIECDNCTQVGVEIVHLHCIMPHILLHPFMIQIMQCKSHVEDHQQEDGQYNQEVRCLRGILFCHHHYLPHPPNTNLCFGRRTGGIMLAIFIFLLILPPILVTKMTKITKKINHFFYLDQN